MKSEAERLADEGYPGEFIPRERGNKQNICDKVPGGWGVPMDDYEYIWYSNIDQFDFNDILTEFSDDITICTPYYHRKAQIDSLRVNEDIQGPFQNGPFDVYSSNVTFSNDIEIVGSVETPSIRGAGGTGVIGVASTHVTFSHKVTAAVYSSSGIQTFAGNSPSSAVTIDASVTQMYSHIASFALGTYVFQISNLLDGRTVFLHFVNAGAFGVDIDINASTTTSSYSNVYLSRNGLFTPYSPPQIQRFGLSNSIGVAAVMVANIGGRFVASLS